MVVLWSWLVAAAWGAQGLLVAPSGDPVPGLSAELQLVLWNDAGMPLAAPPTLEVGGERVRLLPREEPGVWSGVYLPPPDAGEVVAAHARLATGELVPLRLRLGSLAEPSLVAPPAVDGQVGAEVRLRLTGEELPPPEALVVSAPEGRVRGVELRDGALELSWEPGPSRTPRVVVLGLRDGRRSDTGATFTAIRLAARPPMSIRSEPGTEVTVTISARVYGPVTASAEGEAELVVDVGPGESSGWAELRDEAGNVQRVAITPVQDPRPALGALALGELLPGQPPPPVALAAWDSRGRPWRGPAPTCRSAVADTVRVVEAGTGRWLAVLPALGQVDFDVRMDCTLGGGAAQASPRIELASGIPRRVVLQVFPRVLNADFPVAQVQAYLEDDRGERVTAEGLDLSADRGEIIDVERRGHAVRGEYRGAAGFVEDRVWASWRSAEGEGPPAGFQLGAQRLPDGLRADVRVLDRLGRGLVGVPLRVTMGDASVAVTSGERGYVSAELPVAAGPSVLEVTAGGSVGRLALLPWAVLRPLDPAAPDLAASEALGIEAGRVSKVFISAEPSPLYAGSGQSARVEVRLLDRTGLPVVDQTLRLHASGGALTEPDLQDDGTFVARWTPPPGLSHGKVLLSASDEQGSFSGSTSVEVAPRPLRRAATLTVGYLGGFSEIQAPWLGLDLAWRLELLDDHVVARMTLGVWEDRAEVLDGSRDSTVSMRLDSFLAAPTLLYRWERGLWARWAGAGVGVAPYLLEVRYGDDAPLRGSGVHRPGGLVAFGTGYRLLGGEVLGELRALGMGAGASEVGYDGQVGGLSAVLGYRVLY